MIRKFAYPVFMRQKEVFPEAIDSLDTCRNLTKSGILQITAKVSHDLRNQLTIVSVVLDLDARQKGNEPG